MRKISFTVLAAALSLALAIHAKGQAFDDYLTDSTLRIDYIFAGSAGAQEIYLDEISVSEGWDGRRVNLDTVPLKGNGCVTLRDSATAKVLYKQSFSTLFQEWQATEEATVARKSFENVYRLPMPRDVAYVSVELYDLKGRVSASMEHKVDPRDILIRKGKATPAPFKYILRSGESRDCIDVVIVAEGYAKKEAKDFYRHARTAVESIISHEPFKTYKDRFNFIAVALSSEESGVSVPLEDDWRRTALGANFSTFYSDRYLTTLRLRNLADKLGGIPYEHIVILANTDTYGGGGIYNSYTLTTARHEGFKPVVAHEFGHSFAGLGDEYYYDDMYSPYYFPDVEPWEKNITTMADFGSKWASMLPEGVAVTPGMDDGELWRKVADGTPMETFVGLYEGGGYMSKGVYRGFPDCRMKTNAAPAFCPVCQKAIKDMILFYTEEL